MKKTNNSCGAMLAAVAGLFLTGFAMPSYADVVITGGNTVDNNGNVVVDAQSGDCFLGVNYSAPPYNVVVTETGGGTVACAPGVLNYPVGTTLVTCTAGDGKQGTFTVVVRDTQPPRVRVPVDFAKGTDLGQCSAVGNYVIVNQVLAGGPETVDFDVENCPGSCGTCSGPGEITCTPPPGTVFSVGTTPVTCIGTDASGNKHTNSFPVIVSDTEDPVLNCPEIVPPQVVSCFGGPITIPGLGLSASDNCSIGSGITITCIGTNSAGQAVNITNNLGPGQYVFRCNANDEANNSPNFEGSESHSCTIDVTVNQNIGNIVWHAPIANNSCPGPGASHEDIPGIYKFNAGKVIPIQVDVRACGTGPCNSGPSITSTVNGYVIVQLIDQISGDVIAELPEDPAGVGDPSSGLMSHINGHLKFNLKTTGYPAGTVAPSNTLRFKVTIEIKDDPDGVVLGSESIYMESK